MNARILAALALAAAVLVAGCESTPSKPAPPPPPPVPTPPPLQEAPAPVRAQLHAEIAAGFYERGQMEIALQELDLAMKLDSRNAKVYNVYGLVYAMLGEEAKAQANFQTAIELAPTDSEIRQNWGWFLCTHGRAKESLGEFDLAVRNPLYKTPDVALVNAGKCAAEIGDARRAEEYFRRALAFNPNNLNAAYGLSLLAYRQARLDEARALIRRVVQQPSPPAEALYLGMCIERKLGDHPSEASYVSQLRKRHPDSPEARAVPPGVCE
ncbi:MAG: type IV pilus biogenesis/stability protein PilW [Burkholderiales bacterium]|nr:type IV pilus biogenesis/stability protein PilW [Burkholderiales bacterium]